MCIRDRNKTVENNKKYKVKEFIYPDEPENTFGSTEVVLIDEGKKYKSLAYYWGYATL